MGLFHKHDFPKVNVLDSVKYGESDDNGEYLITGIAVREVRVGDDWICSCGKHFFVFTMNYDRNGNEIPQWREAGKFK